MPTNILDCTLRDGGYYNNWDFSNKFVRNYLIAMSASGVNLVELGFRFPPREGFLGPNAFTTDVYLESLELPEDLRCVVMLNGADYLTPEGTNLELLEQTFQPAAESPVSMVRIAINITSATKAQGLCRFLKDSGYDVGLNLMQVSTVSYDVLEKTTETINDWQLADVLYFADSLGNMDSKDIEKTVLAMRKQWSGPLGIHAHNNMGRALENTLLSKQLGVEYLDCTVTGMGRGAGNAQTEYLLLELADQPEQRVSAGPTLKLAAEEFTPLKQRYQWGESLYYRIAAKHSIHPSYVQNMLQQENFDPADILRVLDSLAVEQSTSYNGDRLNTVMNSRSELSISGTADPAKLGAGEEVILLAGGSAGARHIDAVLSLQAHADMSMYSINVIPQAPWSQLRGVFMCDPARIVAGIDELRNLKCPLIAPRNLLSREEQQLLPAETMIDIGVVVGKSELADDTQVQTSKLLTLAYALQILAASGAKRVYLAGFDGYPGIDPRNEDVERIFTDIEESDVALELIAITPTKYSIKQTSVYSLLR